MRDKTIKLILITLAIIAIVGFASLMVIGATKGVIHNEQVFYLGDDVGTSLSNYMIVSSLSNGYVVFSDIGHLANRPSVEVPLIKGTVFKLVVAYYTLEDFGPNWIKLSWDD